MSPKSGPKPMQDVTAPKPAANSEDTGLIQAELEHGIPVKNPDQPEGSLKGASAASNPITQSRQSVEESNKKEEELEPILKDVNQSVAKQDENTPKKSKFSLFKKTAAKKELKPKNTKPIFAVLAAVLVAGALSVAAFYAFKPKEATNSKGSQSAASNGVGSSSNQAQTVNNAVQPADLANLASSLQSKMNSLNDAQDFNQTDLSDQSLGL
jgi:hypothetical protein